MTAWVVRGGSRGEREPEALDNSIVTVGFRLLESWPETPILPKPLFSWRRLPM